MSYNLSSGTHRAPQTPAPIQERDNMPDDAQERNELPTGRLWDIEEAATYLHVSRNTVRRRIADAGLPYERVGVQLRFRKEDLDAWLERQSDAPAEESAA